MDTTKTIVGKCPVCGKEVVKTLRGYACTGSLEQPKSCSFFIFSMIGNRQLSDTEISDFLAQRQILIDGFVTKEGKAYTSILQFNQEGSVESRSQVGKCPVCGGDMYASGKSIYCSNFRESENPCHFQIWRNIGGHQLSITEIHQITTTGRTESPIKVYDAFGNCKMQHIGLSLDKKVVLLGV